MTPSLLLRKAIGGIIVPADIIIFSTGVHPESGLTKGAGLELGMRDTIKVNEYLRTSAPSIYATGDAMEVKDFISGAETMIPLVWPANRQGRLGGSWVNKSTSLYPQANYNNIRRVSV